MRACRDKQEIKALTPRFHHSKAHSGQPGDDAGLLKNIIDVRPLFIHQWTGLFSGNGRNDDVEIRRMSRDDLSSAASVYRNGISNFCLNAMLPFDTYIQRYARRASYRVRTHAATPTPNGTQRYLQTRLTSTENWASGSASLEMRWNRLRQIRGMMPSWSPSGFPIMV